MTLIGQANINSDSNKPSVTIKGRNISGLFLEYLFVSQQGMCSKETRDIIEVVTSYTYILKIDINTKCILRLTSEIVRVKCKLQYLGIRVISDVGFCHCVSGS